MKPYLIVLALAFIQNVSFSMVSRARNRNSTRYHLITAIFSNTIWFLTVRELVLAKMPLLMFLPYAAGTVSGSLVGATVSQWFERKLGAASDDHLKGSQCSEGMNSPNPRGYRVWSRCELRNRHKGPHLHGDVAWE